MRIYRADTGNPDKDKSPDAVASTPRKRTYIAIGSHVFRANRVFIIAVALLASLSIMWPGYPLFSGIEPFILGLPLSFAWMILWVIIGFAAMVALYISDNKEEHTD